MRPRFALVMACVAIASWSLFQGSMAAVASDAEELIREGVTLRRRGDDAAALQKFQQAFQIEQSPRATAQLGLAEQALGRWAGAYEHLTQALAASSDQWMKKNREVIAEALTHVNDHVGKLEILGGSPGAEIRVDGAARGRLPLLRPMVLATGTVTIDLTTSGHIPVQRTTVIRARETVRESFDPLASLPLNERAPGAAVDDKVPGRSVAAVIPSPPAAATVVPNAALAPAAAEATGGAPQTEAAPEQSSEHTNDGDANDNTHGLRRAAKWVAWGAGAAALGVGFFGLSKQNAAGESFSAGCAIDGVGVIHTLPESTKSVTQCKDLQSEVDSKFRLEVIGFVSAAALIGTGIILWLTEPTAVDQRRAALSCAPSAIPARTAFMTCQLSF